ncbi:MAG: hypothetical protein WDZ94_05490 [Patescibacteria group bacterium]
MSNIPRQFQFLFPSSQVSELRIDKDQNFIIESLLKNATLEAWQWLRKTYSAADIGAVVKSSQNLRKKDVMLWSLVLDIPHKDIACLQTKSPAGLSSSWAY